MADMQYVFFDGEVRLIECAYQAGRDAILHQVEEADAYLDRFNTDVREGRIPAEITDEETGQTFYSADFPIYNLEYAKDVLNLHCQAFTVMLHHAWEKHVCSSQGWEEYRSNTAYGILKYKKKWSLDIPRLERLRMTTNCVKHDSGDLYGEHPNMFNPQLIPIEGKKKALRHWRDGLIVQNGDVIDFIDTVRVSAKNPLTQWGGWETIG